MRINLASVGDPPFAEPLWAEMQRLLAGISVVRDDVLRIAYGKIG